jgi:hypothetical protein
MKQIFLFCLILSSYPAVSQWTGPDASSKIYYSKGFVGIGEIPQYRFHLKTTDVSPLIFGETPEASFAFMRHWLELKAKPAFTQTPFISWFTPQGVRQALLGLRTDAFGLKLENGFSFLINGGNVGIGTEDTKGYQLAVGGKLISEEIVVKLKGNWPDYVFGSNYPLPPLEEVSQYIIENNHLPEIPSEREVRQAGVNLNDMTTVMLKKIEELTLYLLEERKASLELKKRIEALENLSKQDEKK